MILELLYGLLLLEKVFNYDPFAVRAGDNAKLYRDVGSTWPHWMCISKEPTISYSDGVLKVMMRMDWWTEMRLFVSVVLV